MNLICKYIVSIDAVPQQKTIHAVMVFTSSGLQTRPASRAMSNPVNQGRCKRGYLTCLKSTCHCASYNKPQLSNLSKKRLVKKKHIQRKIVFKGHLWIGSLCPIMSLCLPLLHMCYILYVFWEESSEHKNGIFWPSWSQCKSVQLRGHTSIRPF